MGQPYFCRFICPAGTLEAGLTLLILRPNRTLGQPSLLRQYCYANLLGVLSGALLPNLVSPGPFTVFSTISFWRLKVKESFV